LGLADLAEAAHNEGAKMRSSSTTPPQNTRGTPRATSRRPPRTAGITSASDRAPGHPPDEIPG
jgi:hypothetical protein